MMRRLLPKLRRTEAEEGQALVEFALVLPLILMIFLGVMWFWEIVQVKLKVQEAARFAAWEATAYPLHDYGKGRVALATKFNAYRTHVMIETTTRYLDLDSASLVPQGTQLMMASWTPPAPIIVQYPEEVAYGGPIVSFVAKFAGSAAALAGSVLYGSENKTAKELIGGWQGASADVMFGTTEWGFNSNGYSAVWVSTYITNEWFNVRIMGQPIFDRSGYFIKEFHGVLADSWRLNTGQTVAAGGIVSPGWSKNTKMYKQVARMYLSKKTVRAKAMAKITELQGYATTILTQAQDLGATTLTPKDFIAASVVSVPYKGGVSSSGKITLATRRGPKRFDTAPYVDAYKSALSKRGEYFMGCKEGEKLGCTHTLAQDDPFGDYIARE